MKLYRFVTYSFCFFSSLSCEMGALPSFNNGNKVFTLSTRYTQGAGIGYNSSYTTLEGFLALQRRRREWNPYLDLRSHFFNNGTFSGNAGVGMRYISSVAWGANVYYDYRKTSRNQYNQIGAGLEMIGSFWSASLNGYLPFGKKKSPFFNPSFTSITASPQFAFFQGNRFFLSLSGSEALFAKQEFTFKGIDANIAFQVVKKSTLSAELEIGPYYFEGYYAKSAFGAKGSLLFRIKNILSVGIMSSYDSLFHSRLQGTVGFSFPLGPRCVARKCSERLRPLPSLYNIRLSHGAQRNEITVVDQHEKLLRATNISGTVVAINPITGLPYVVWFVDNTSSSNGTFESPFNQLIDAQMASGPNDLIYVFPGDGSSMGMDTGILLQTNQQLLGAGTPIAENTTLGTVVIPAHAIGSPLITNIAATDITLADNNVLSGLHLGTNIIGVMGAAIQNLQVLSCTIESDSAPISLTDFTGIATIRNNILANYENTGLNVTSLSGNNSLTIASNIFTSLNGAANSFGIVGSLSGSSQTGFSISENTFSEHTATAMNLSSSNSSVLNSSITNNTITAPAGGVNTFGIQLSPGGSSATAMVTGNRLVNHKNNSLNVTADAAVAFSIIALNNTFQAISGTSLKAIALDNTITSSSHWNAIVQNNLCSGGFTQADIYLNPRGSSILNATITANTTLGNNVSPFGIQLDADDTAIIQSAIVSNNICRNHTSSEMSYSSRGTATAVTTTIANNQLTGQVNGSSGIQCLSSVGGTLTATISGNTCTDFHNSAINLSSTNAANLTATISSNHLIAPAGINNTMGINATSSNTSSLTFSALDNTFQNHTGVTISGHFDGAGGSATLLRNAIIGIGGTSLKAIALDSGNTSSLSWSANIQNNVCTGGFTQADIYLDPQGTSTLTNAIVSGNTTVGDVGGTSPFGIQLDVDNTAHVSSLTISNNKSSNHISSEIAINTRGPANQVVTTISDNQLTTNGVATVNGIQVTANNAGVVNADIMNNICSGQKTSGIQVSCNTGATLTSVISGNILTAPLGIANVNGISLNADGLSTNLSITNNTCSQYEAFSIQLNFGGSAFTGAITDNTVITGNVTGNAFGILTALGGNTHNMFVQRNNISTPVGGVGSQFGIVWAQLTSHVPAVTQVATITNNIVTNCGNAPPAFSGFTGGIVAALENTDNLFADMESNILTNCATATLGGAAGARINAGFGTPGHMCWKLVNNTSNTNYSLINDPPTGLASEFTLDASGNVGTVNPIGGSPFTAGTCP